MDNAVRLDGVFVVVAAGNEHDRAQALRANGFGANFDTEVSCPGHAREALTVGATTKASFLPASFSSRGPSADGRDKPDVCAPGVNITSTIPAPRLPNGDLVPSPPRASLFGVKSGTSMATPIVHCGLRSRDPAEPIKIRNGKHGSRLVPWTSTR